MLKPNLAAKTAEPSLIFYAHSRDGCDKTRWQRLADHLYKTANLAYELGRDAGVSEMARMAGLLHDIGKYSKAFQRRLEGTKWRVDHATAGAREITTLFKSSPLKPFAEIISYCIAGHHSGLPDYGSMLDVEGDSTLLARRDKKKLEDYSNYKTEINTSTLTFQPRLIKPIHDHYGFSASFLTRMVFSTLVDADWIETETYINGGKKPRGDYDTIEKLCQEFNLFLK